jgi:hypothetical protein
MDSNLCVDKLSEVMSCDTPVEESESGGTFPMDLAAILEERFGWTAVGFSRAALSRQFEQARDSPSPFFHNRVHYQMYQGGIDIRSMHSDQQCCVGHYLRFLASLLLSCHP